MNKPNNPRAAALASLIAWEKKGRYANLEVNAALNGSSMSEADRRLYTVLVYGVIERAITLDFVMEKLSARPISAMDEEVRCALRLGLYQLKFMDRIPPHAAVSETVALVPQRTRSFVNAILRTFLRGGCEIPLPPVAELFKRLSVQYSAPEELCRFWTEHYGEATAEEILASTLRNPAVTVRVNPLKTTAQALLDTLDGAQISPLSEDMLVLANGAHIADGVRDGMYIVQDPASRLAVCALDPKPGETIIDTCAAPGGKSLSAAMDMHNTGKIYSFDLHENKLSLIRRSADALGITNIEAVCRDGRSPDPALFGKADRVLCDAPCSGLGVIGKKPDIKYKPLSLAEALPEIQHGILCGAAKYVKDGGVLVYSTCTLNPCENEQVVERFLAAHADFALVPIDLGRLGTEESGMRTFFSHKDGCDGFFIAKMIRKS